MSKLASTQLVQSVCLYILWPATGVASPTVDWLFLYQLFIINVPKTDKYDGDNSSIKVPSPQVSLVCAWLVRTKSHWYPEFSLSSPELGTMIPTTTTHTLKNRGLVLWWDSLRSHKWQGKGLKSEWTGIITNLAFPRCCYRWWIFVRKWTCHWNSCFGVSNLKWWPSPSAQMRRTVPVPSLQRIFCLPK